MDFVDARGKPCPTPVMMVREKVLAGAEALTVLLDDAVAVANVDRFLGGAGYRVTREDTPDGVRLHAARTNVECAPAAAPPAPGDAATILIKSRFLGAESEGLGEVLMKSFLGAVALRDAPPQTVALMNDAVFLALPESSCAQTLREMEARGATVLVCGTCTKHFGVTDRVAAGRVSNMFEIVEAVFGANRSVVIG